MSKTIHLSLIALTLGCLFFLVSGPTLEEADAQSSPSPSTRSLSGKMLTGSLRSADGKPLEGVVVSARHVSKTFTTSVFSDEKGDYFFPVLDAGQYRVWAQAVGFEAGRAELSLDPNKEVRQNFTLKTNDDFAPQLSGAEWLAALPGDNFQDRRMKEIFANNCVGCHPAGFPLQNRFDKAGWLAMITAMEFAGSAAVLDRSEPLAYIVHFKEELATYLAKARGPGPSPMKFKPLPRPTGDAAKAVITTFDVPPALTPDELHIMDGSDWSHGTPSAYQQWQLHDVTADFFGNAWLTTSGDNRVRSYVKVDGKTGEVTNFPVPGQGEWVATSHEITTGPDGIVWLNFRRPFMLGRVDPQTAKLETFTSPTSMNPVGNFVDVDGKGKVWAATRQGGIRFDPETKKFTDFISPSVKEPKFSTYGVAGDSDGNGWWAIVTDEKVGRGDPKTGKTLEVPFAPRREKMEFTTEDDRNFYNRRDKMLVTAGNAPVWARTPRRLAADNKGYLWSADFMGQDIGRVNIRTLKVDYYDLPIAYANPYDVHVDNNRGLVWATLKTASRVARFEIKTQKWTIYQLPNIGTECENIYVDQKSGDVWLAAGRTSQAIRLQFR